MVVEIVDDYTVIVDGKYELDINKNIFNKLAFYKNAYEIIDVIEVDGYEFLVVNNLRIFLDPMNHLAKSIRCLFEELQEEINVIEPREEKMEWIL